MLGQRINVSNLSQDVYLLKLETNKGPISKKFLKNKDY
jgi:hypothetical protein